MRGTGHPGGAPGAGGAAAGQHGPAPHAGALPRKGRVGRLGYPSLFIEWELTSLCRLQRGLPQVGAQDAYTAGTVRQTVKPYVLPRLCDRKAPPMTWATFWKPKCCLVSV